LPSRLTAWALAWYAAGLIGHSVLEVLTRAFYARQDTKTPVLVGAAAMALNVAFSFAFSALFLQAGWLPLGGLALANSLATALEAVALLWIMRKRLGGIEGPALLDGGMRIGVAALGMALALWFWMKVVGEVNPWVAGLGGVVAGGVVYAMGVVLLKVPEVQSLIVFLKRKATVTPRK
jgi:putative peptidoglycan lipid II flippase